MLFVLGSKVQSSSVPVHMTVWKTERLETIGRGGQGCWNECLAAHMGGQVSDTVSERKSKKKSILQSRHSSIYSLLCIHPSIRWHPGWKHLKAYSQILSISTCRLYPWVTPPTFTDKPAETVDFGFPFIPQ